jgi:CheY-like chemotaxis protein
MIPGGMGGADTAQEIRKAYGNSVTILAISGHGDAQAIAEPHKYGFDAGISKPFTKADLIRGLGKAVRHHL